MEWVGLYENHRDLFDKAVKYEKMNKNDAFTWIKDLPLEELVKPENIKKIKEKHFKKLQKLNSNIDNKLVDIFTCDEDSENFCPLCNS